MDALFKALNDSARRAIMDSLRQRDGQTLTDLEAQLDMTRFGVMKHLKVLEEAGLVIPRKAGRFKHHYLNPLPLQGMVDRWIDPFLQPQAAALSRLKTQLETKTMSKPDFMMQTFIRCTRDALWDALTDADAVGRWHFLSPRVEKQDETYTYYQPDGAVMMAARTLDLRPKDRIEATFEPNWEGGGAPSRTVYLIDEEGAHCRLTVEHYDLTFPVVPGEGVHDGWHRWAAGLKTYLETGEATRFTPQGEMA